MIDLEVISQTPLEDLLVVKVKLMSREINSVEEVEIGALDRSSDFHKELHDKRITHRHNHMNMYVTVYLEPPFSEEKLSAALIPTISRMERLSIDAFAVDDTIVQERMFVNGGEEKNFYKMVACPDDVRDTLLAAFPEVNLDTIALISTPSWHNIAQQTVITAFLYENDIPGLQENGVPLITKARKYCLEAGLFYDRCYAFAQERPTFVPEGCVVMAQSFHVNVPPELELPNFYDVYFSGDAATVEAAFGLEPLTGKVNTYYGVTVLDGEVLRAKQYCYDTTTVFSDWDRAMDQIAADHGMTHWGVR